MTTLISIDPSTRATGLAVFTGHDLTRCGLIKPKAEYTKNGIKYRIPSHTRIDELINRLGLFIADYKDPRFVVEITSGKSARRLKKNVQGLGTYGMTVGQVVRFLIEQHGADRVQQVYENDWTRGKSKESRRENARLGYPAYRQWLIDNATKRTPDADRGMDVSDAVMLGDCELNTRVLREQERISA